MLNINNLSKKFHSKTILNHVSLAIPKGSIAVLIGGSGVGKSTLLRILNNLETYDSGTIELDGTLLDPKTISASHRIGMVFQQFNLFENLSVIENITFPLEKALNKTKEEATKIAQMLLKEYGLEERAFVYPRNLSGGQKQRLAIARTIALKPQVICLDEPTSALDPLLTNYVAQNIQDLASQGYIVLVATHDIGLLERLDCSIYLMEKGNVIQSASSKEFIANKDAYPKIKHFVEGF